MTHAELEIAVRRNEVGHYLVALRYARPDSEVDVWPVFGEARLDVDELRATTDPERHGQALTRALFHDEALLGFYARVKSNLGDLPLRVRVFVDRGATELDTLRWELLRDPETDAPLGLSERVMLSRYLCSSDWRPVRRRPRSQSRALVAVANGRNLDDYVLAPINLERETALARAGLAPIPVTLLGGDRPVTLAALLRILRDQQPDILYLIAHGRVHAQTGEPLIYLQNDAGAVEVTTGSEFAARLGEIAGPPALIVLASCESAGGDTVAASPALAQRLNAAGVPAILAMQGRISMATAQRIMPLFFAELAKDGQVDRALAVARGAARDRRDAWAPVLFMRLKEGRLWLDEATPAPLPFSDLADHLKAASRPPTWADFEQEHFYHDADRHARIEALLDGRHRTLLVGRSGSGKSALALSVGYRFLQADPAHRVFYTKHPQDAARPWLEAMLRHDRDEALFIIDNVHNSLEACNELAELLGQVRRARVMLVSQPVDAALAGPEDENYFDLLDAAKVEMDLDGATLRGVLAVLAQRAADLEIGDEAALLANCQGNLHLLRFYVNAWEEQPHRRLSEIEETAVLQRVHAEYLRNKRYAPALARLAALSQFEIAHERRLLGADGDSLAADPLCESLHSPQNDPQLQIYHSTPARYLVLAHLHATEGLRRVDDWLAETIEAYLHGNPGNFFAVFSQLYRAGRRELQHSLFARLPLAELFAARLAGAHNLADLDVHHLVRFVRGVWIWENRDSNGIATSLLHQLDEWMRGVEGAIRRSPDGAQFLVIPLAQWTFQIEPKLASSWFMLAASITAVSPDSSPTTPLRRLPDLTPVVGAGNHGLHKFDWSELGRALRIGGISTLRSLLALAMAMGVDKASLREFTAELDWSSLGQRARQNTPRAVSNFLRACTSAGVAPASLRIFAEQLDWTDLGRRSRDYGLTAVGIILDMRSRSGIEKAQLLQFANALDWSALGRRARDVGTPTILNFLINAHVMGIAFRPLRTFCAELNWAALGRFFQKKEENRASMLYALHTLSASEHVSREMAREFVEGWGWDDLRLCTNEVFGVDVLTACHRLLYHKCGYQPAELAAKDVDFRRPAWQRSFLRPITPVPGGGDGVRAPYLRNVLRRLGPGGLSEILVLVTELRDLNILLRNAELLQPGWGARHLEPWLLRWPDWRWQLLITASDLRNLGTFLSHFAPDGLFSWRPPARVNYPVDSKLATASVEELAHCLFNFRFIDRPGACRDLALKLERWPTIAEKLAGASLQRIEFFFWNYWLALPPGSLASLCHRPDLVNIALSKLGDRRQHEVFLLGLLGTWVIAGGPELERLQAPVRVREARRLCLELAEERSSALLRSLLGLSSLTPAPSAEDAAIYRAALREIHGGPLVIEAVDRALARLEAWLAPT